MDIFLAIYLLSWLILSSTAESPSNLSFYSIWFIPHAPISLFQSTLMTPAGAPEEHTPGDVQAVWPGLEPDDGKAVLQNVVANQGPKAGQWFFLPFYCCEPAEQLRNSTEVHPGDAITSIFALDTMNNHWANIWFDSPGTTGTRAGQNPFSGALSFDFDKHRAQNSTANDNPYTTAVLAIELQGKSTWNFGPVVWQNILVEAGTSEEEWCLKPTVDRNLNVTYSTPSVTHSGGKTLCRVESITFHNPIEGA